MSAMGALALLERYPTNTCGVRLGRFRTGEGLVVDVEVLDARMRFGTEDVKVSGFRGSPHVWVEARRVDPLEL